MFKLIRKAKTTAGQRVCVLGVGGGGVCAIGHVLGGGGEEGTLAVLNTDASSLNASHAVTKIQIGRQSGADGGTGGDPVAGRAAAEHDIEMIRGLLSDCDVLLLAACLGGGTGTGAAPVVLNVARNAGIFTLAVVTLPFEFEGGARRRIAQEGLKAVTDAADFVSVISNDRLFEATGAGGSLATAFVRADEALAAGVCSLWHMVMQPMLIGVDRGDFRMIVEKGGGSCLYGFGTGTGAGRTTDAVRAVVEGPVFEAGQGLRACSAALICVCGSHDITLQEVSEVITGITEVLPDDCNLRIGAVINEAWRSRLFVSIFAADRKRTVTPVPRGGKRANPAVRNGSIRPTVRVRVAQEELEFDGGDRGRFNSMAATILDGENLDLPTFIRRGIPIEKQDMKQG